MYIRIVYSEQSEHREHIIKCQFPKKKVVLRWLQQHWNGDAFNCFSETSLQIVMRHVCCYSEVCLQMVHLRPAWGGHVLFDALIGRESVFGTLCFTISIYRSFLQYLKNILKRSNSRRLVKPLISPICIFWNWIWAKGPKINAVIGLGQPWYIWVLSGAMVLRRDCPSIW